jgi:hypothetical protein
MMAAANNDALSVMATAYGVKRGARRSTSEVAKRVRDASVLQHPGMLDDVRLESFAQVVGIFAYNDPEEFDGFRSGAPIPALREAMVQMVEVYEGDRLRAEQVVDLVLADLAAKVRTEDQ